MPEANFFIPHPILAKISGVPFGVDSWRLGPQSVNTLS